MFFFLAQTEQGDIFKITLETDEDMVSCCVETTFLDVSFNNCAIVTFVIFKINFLIIE